MLVWQLKRATMQLIHVTSVGLQTHNSTVPHPPHIQGQVYIISHLIIVDLSS